MPPGFVDFVLGIVNANCDVWVTEPPGDDLETVTRLPCPSMPPPPPRTQVEGALKGKDASFEQNVEDPEPRAQPSIAIPECGVREWGGGGC